MCITSEHIFLKCMWKMDYKVRKEKKRIQFWLCKAKEGKPREWNNSTSRYQSFLKALWVVQLIFFVLRLLLSCFRIYGYFLLKESCLMGQFWNLITLSLCQQHKHYYMHHSASSLSDKKQMFLILSFNSWFVHLCSQ